MRMVLPFSFVKQQPNGHEAMASLPDVLTFISLSTFCTCKSPFGYGIETKLSKGNGTSNFLYSCK